VSLFNFMNQDHSTYNLFFMRMWATNLCIWRRKEKYITVQN